MKLNSSASVAVFLMPLNADPSQSAEDLDAKCEEYFPGKASHRTLTNTLPADLPKDLTDHMLGLKAKHPESQYMVIRPVNL